MHVQAPSYHPRKAIVGRSHHVPERVCAWLAPCLPRFASHVGDKHQIRWSNRLRACSSHTLCMKILKRPHGRLRFKLRHSCILRARYAAAIDAAPQGVQSPRSLVEGISACLQAGITWAQGLETGRLEAALHPNFARETRHIQRENERSARRRCYADKVDNRYFGCLYL